MKEYSMIDNIDLKILKLLQTDGRIGNAQLANAVNVSPATCHRRVQRLFDEGIINSVRACINPKYVKRETLIFVGVVLERSTPNSFIEFEQAVVKLSFILECNCIAGDFDYLLKIRTKDNTTFNSMHREKLLSLPNVRQLRSFFTLKEVIENNPLEF